MKEKTAVLQAALVLAVNLLLAFVFITALPAYFNKKLFIGKNPPLREAGFYEKTGHGVKCNLCPRKCFLPEGMRGKCRVRASRAGKLYTMVYGRPAAIHVDPVEKKPVYHLKPGSYAFSIATKGCNLRCKCCQNWQLSQSGPEQGSDVFFSPQSLVEMAEKNGCESIAYTYSEPIIFYEYMLETAKLAKEKGIYNIMVSAGYIEKEPLEALIPYLDVIKIDLKGFNDKFYRDVVGCGLEDILETLRVIKKYGKLVELVNLVIPGMNDGADEIKEMCAWVRENMGKETPVFFSRFHPAYRMTNLPPTPVSALMRAYKTAKEQGLEYVYIGNVPGTEYENTYCPKCGRVLVERRGYTIGETAIENGVCKYCGHKIPGIW